MEGEAEEQLKLHVEVFILWDFLSDPSMSPRAPRNESPLLGQNCKLCPSDLDPSP